MAQKVERKNIIHHSLTKSNLTKNDKINRYVEAIDIIESLKRHRETHKELEAYKKQQLKLGLPSIVLFAGSTNKDSKNEFYFRKEDDELS